MVDYLSLSIWGGYDAKPKGADQSFGQIFKQIVGDDTKVMVVGGVFSEAAAADAVANHTDLIGGGRGILIAPFFGKKILDGQGDTIVSHISPEQVKKAAWTPGLFEAFTREDSLGLPALPGQESILSLHTGQFGEAATSLPTD